QVVFIESIYTDEALICANMVENNASSPEYADMEREEALRDYDRRIQQYQKKYSVSGADGGL
ncbi:unnamed protein product, partial [Discosporangium mesarthrocarpum]